MKEGAEGGGGDRRAGTGEPGVDTGGGAPELSVVVPVYRTAWALPELALRVRRMAQAEGLAHELILVDDASPDGGREVAAELARTDPAVQGVALPENVGQHRAVLAGLAAARGAWVAVLDGDLQDPPEAIPGLLERARDGFDAVFAARVGRYQSAGRMVTSRLFKGLLARLCGLPEGSGMYFLASRRLVERIVPCDDPAPFVVALVGLAGLPVSAVPVPRERRRVGGSAYSAPARLRAGVRGLAFARRWRRRQRRRSPFGGADPGGPNAPGRAGSREPTPTAAMAALAGGWGAVAGAWSFATARGRPLDLGDEGFRYLLSRAWADGEGLFESFRLLYVPGQYAYFGTFLRALGPELEVLRLAVAVLGGLAVAVVAAAVGRAAGPALAAVAGGAAAFATLPGYATLASALVLAAAVDLAVRTGGRRPVGAAWVLGAAALAGALAGWREDSAVLALILACAGAAARRRPGDLLRLVLPGAVLGFAPWFAVFALRGPFPGEAPELLAHLGRRVLFLGQRLAVPSPSSWSFPTDPLASPRELADAFFPVLAAVPPAVYLGVLAREGLRWRRRRAVHAPTLAAALVGVAYLPHFLWERPDLAHLRAHLHLLVGVTAVAAAALGPRGRRLAASALVAAGGLAAAYGLAARGSSGADTVPYPCCEGRRIGARVPGPAPPWAGLGGEPGDFLVLGWGPGWYALEGTAPPTPYLYTDRWGLRRPGDPAALAADAVDGRVRYVLARSLEGQAPEVGRAVKGLFTPRSTWRGWTLWERSGSG